MATKSVNDLPPGQLLAARGIAQRLADAGYPSWIVGGAARDLARGVQPKDLDMVTTATPDQVEALFPRTIGVGRAFGILIVPWEGVDVELATLRTEQGYRDGRRPDEVSFGTSVEEDAGRRDFTCNALYLAVLTDEWIDPAGGLADLEARVLRTVGDPHRRFAEDGLRLLRLARFQARLDFDLAPGVAEAAAESLDALRGVSPERVREELTRILTGPRHLVALATLAATGVLPVALPVGAGGAGWDRRLALFAGLPTPPGEVLGWAALLDPPGALTESDLAALEATRPSREQHDRILRVWQLRRLLPRLGDGAERIRALREEVAPLALTLAKAHASLAGEDLAPLEALEAWRASRSAAELFPAPWLSSDDLAAAQVPRGPLWGKLLRAAEDEQLEGRLTCRKQALAWLARWEDLA